MSLRHAASCSGGSSTIGVAPHYSYGMDFNAVVHTYQRQKCNYNEEYGIRMPLSELSLYMYAIAPYDGTFNVLDVGNDDRSNDTEWVNNFVKFVRNTPLRVYYGALDYKWNFDVLNAMRRCPLTTIFANADSFPDDYDFPYSPYVTEFIMQSSEINLTITRQIVSNFPNIRFLTLNPFDTDILTLQTFLTLPLSRFRHSYEFTDNDLKMLQNTNIAELDICTADSFIGEGFKYLPKSLRKLRIRQGMTNIRSNFNHLRLPDLREISIPMMMTYITIPRRIVSLPWDTLKTLRVVNAARTSGIEEDEFIHFGNILASEHPKVKVFLEDFHNFY